MRLTIRGGTPAGPVQTAIALEWEPSLAQRMDWLLDTSCAAAGWTDGYKKKLSSHMDHISEHINALNHKNHSYDKMSKTVVNLGSNKCENNNKSTFEFSCLQNSLLMSIVETPEKYLSNVDRKLDMIKVRTSSVNSSSTLFIFSTFAMYNRFNCVQKQLLMLKSYITGIIT